MCEYALVFLCVYAHRRISIASTGFGARNLSPHALLKPPGILLGAGIDALRGLYKALQGAQWGGLVCPYLTGTRAAFQGLVGAGALVVGSEATKGQDKVLRSAPIRHVRY